MKKVFLLSSLFLCAAGVFAAENRADSSLDGKKRNEDAYERMLEQTGWKNAMTSQPQKSSSESTHGRLTESPRPKNG